MKGLWPHVRAVLIVYHLLAVTLMALPSPGGGMSRGQWSEPTVQAEFRAWNARLGALGVHLTDAEFEDRLYALARSVVDVREKALVPFGPYYRWCRTGQSWRMFVAPHMFPERLHVDVEIDGAWRTLYVERDPRFAWNATKLDQDRVRSLIFRLAWTKYRPSFGPFADWVGREALRDHPAATRVRLRYWKQRSPTPAQARAGVEPAGDWDDTVVRRLEPR